MTPKERAAMQQALEALIEANVVAERYQNADKREEAITALREALAEPQPMQPTNEQLLLAAGYMKKAEQAEQEPVLCVECGKPTMHMGNKCYACCQKATKELEDALKASAPVQQAEKEPVAYMFKVKRTLPSSTPLDVFAAIEYHPLPHEDIISKEPLYAAPVPVTTPDVCGEVCARAKLCYGCNKDLEEANAKYAEHKCGGCAKTAADGWALYCVECWEKAEPVKQEPVAWQGAEEWEPLAFQLCADENGEESCNELLWDGGVIPEPWGERWLKYEDEAKRMIEYVRKYAAHVRTKDLTDEEAAAAAYKGFDDYWTKDCKGIEAEAWLASARAVIAADREKNK